MATAELVYNPYAFDLHDDPYDLYRRLRDDAPAYWNPELKFWVISRFADVLDGFRDFDLFSSEGGVALESRRKEGDDILFQQMIELDPPDHTSFRKLVSRVFTGRRVAEMETEIRRIFNTHVDKIIDAGQCDVVNDLSSPYPMDVICAVLGVPEEDREPLRLHSDKIMIREDGKMEIPKVAMDGMMGLVQYFIDDLAQRKEQGGEGLITDLLGLEVEGRELTEAELLGFCILFVVAGHETTTKMVANALELLDRHPEQKAAVVADPSLIPNAVEEVLRFHNSTQYMHRTLTRDHEMHGQQMKKDDSVLLLIGAANHDEREFGATAEEFNIFRKPDRHLGFGYGAHFCLGAALARMEGKVALEEIFRRLPDHKVNHETKVRFHSSNVTGWTHLPITFTPGGAA